MIKPAEKKKDNDPGTSSSSADMKGIEEEQSSEAQKMLEMVLPAIGENEYEEKMIVNGEEITPESTLKELKSVQVLEHWSDRK